jgi:UDP-N-acetylmuramate: L-alanyl-gamma-D-glutamyl-meso-diaminopimelate ligase
LNFSVSARLGEGRYFVIEADEYDTAFFDKRSKFVHYRPRTAVMNNLEFDHADIFTDLAAIETQFHHLVRTIPQTGLVLANGSQQSLDRVIERGLWSPLERFGFGDCDWSFEDLENIDGKRGADFAVIYQGKKCAEVHWARHSGVMGVHNQLNGLAAIAAAHHIGITPEESALALAEFKNVKRRLELIGEKHRVHVYDDFAHHPTAIATTIDGLRKQVGEARILAVLEPRSNTMKLGVMKSQLPDSLREADLVFAYGAISGKDALGWDLQESIAPLGSKAKSFHDLGRLVEAVCSEAKPHDHVLVMSNGGFGGVHQKILARLEHLNP